MTIEELQAEVLNLQEQLSDKNTEIENIKNSLNDSENKMQEQLNKIDELRKFNNDLFMRVQQNTPEPQIKDEKQEKMTSVDDIINILGG